MNYKGGKGTRLWGQKISEAVKEAKEIREALEKKGYKFESAGDGTLRYKVTTPDGAVRCSSIWDLRGEI